METIYTKVFCINSKLVIADNINRAIEVYQYNFPDAVIHSVTAITANNIWNDYNALMEVK